MNQNSLFEDSANELNAAAAFDRDASKRSLDDLFVNTSQYKTGDKYHALLNFVVRLKRYAPFNAMLINIQKPGAKYALSPSQWMREFGRTIKPSGQAITILKTMGPVPVWLLERRDGGAQYQPRSRHGFSGTHRNDVQTADENAKSQ